VGYERHVADMRDKKLASIANNFLEKGFKPSILEGVFT
jgi:hypothetical protein